MSEPSHRRAEADVEAGLAAGQEAINCITASVAALASRIDALRPAVDLLLQATGRVVVTGLGKSGLVGAKLSATLSSTGTCSSFVHAAEALHGDSGSVAPGDVVIAISNSGETAEVCAFADLLQRRRIPVIALTGCGGSSTLARMATVVVDVGVEREADPFDLVPTCSTVVTAVVGDAIAIAAMVARGFGPDDFHQYHPGGSLGLRLTPESAGKGSA